MSNDLPRLGAAQFSTRASAPTGEARFWRRYRNQLLVNEYAAIGHIHICPAAPHDFAVTSSTRVQVYSSRTRSIARTVSRFTDVVHSAAFRGDGRLLAAGDATGLVQVFDASSRSILKSIDVHKLPTHCVQFSPHSQTTLLTASDDKTIRIWDLGSDVAKNTFKGHEDYVRSAACLPNSPHLYVSGAYDGTVRMWDARVKERGGEVARLRHESNVECVLPLSNGTTMASGGGLQTRIWDLVSMSEQPLRTLQNHARGVSTLSLNGAGTRLISGGLDGHLKIYDTTEWKVVHGVRYPTAITSAAVSPDDKHLVVGMSNGVLSIRTRSKRDTLHTPSNDPRRAKSKTVQRFLRGAEYNPRLDPDPVLRSATTVAVDDNPRTSNKALKPWDRALRRYAYSDALDLILPPSQPPPPQQNRHSSSDEQNPQPAIRIKDLEKLSSYSADPAIVHAVLTDLKHRSGLRTALSNRDEVSLSPILRWLIRYMSDPRMQSVAIDVSMCILSIYGGALGVVPTVERLVDRLGEKVTEQVDKARQATLAQGALQMLVSASSTGATVRKTIAVR